jgi:hypothetical protein
MDLLAPVRSALTGLCPACCGTNFFRRFPNGSIQIHQPSGSPASIRGYPGKPPPQIHPRCKTDVAASRQRAAILICQENPAFSRKPLRGIGCSNSFRVFSFPFVTQRSRSSRLHFISARQVVAPTLGWMLQPRCGCLLGRRCCTALGLSDAAPPPYRESDPLPADPNYGVLHPLNNIPIALESVPETKIYAPT